MNVGLKTPEVTELRKQYGFNDLPIKKMNSLLKTLIDILLEPIFSLLIGAGLIYLIIGSTEDAITLLGFISISIVITLFQQRKSERALEALKDLSSPHVWVIRDGQSQKIPSRELVVGDVLILQEGERVVADAELIESHDLLIDESLLTGESEAVEKTQQKITTQPKNHLIFSGCMIIRGSGLALVTAIGAKTEIGKIGKSLETIVIADSPLQKDIRQLIRKFATFGIALSIAVTLIYGFIHDDWLRGVLSGITLTMALLPEELTVILTVFMALGAWRISRLHVLTRHAPVIETLGSINVLCVDKTGTLTQNKMSLEALATKDAIVQLIPEIKELSQSFKELLSHAVLASEIKPFDPMEKAFHESLLKFHPEHHEVYQDQFISHEYPLSHELPAMTHLWQDTSDPQNHVVAIKGSPEAVLKLCKLTNAEIDQIQIQISKMASQGLRILGVAKSKFKKTTDSWPQHPNEFEFEWLGLTGLKDPLRIEVPESIQVCRSAGIRVVMITGDHALTAQSIAQQAGIDDQKCISGPEIEMMSDIDLQESIKNCSIFVRIQPHQKLRIVQAFQNNQQIIAMTGDGINDAPALKAAHVGISMGQRGTDVAREASSLVLLNDDFSSIVHSIKQGRQIYDNLHKAVIYVLAVHIPIAGAVFIPLIFGAPPMLSPIHILFLEMIIDPASAIVFEMEEAEKNIMERPPRNINAKFFDLDRLSLAIFQGLILLIFVVGSYLFLLNNNASHELATTISFSTLIIGNLLLIMMSRSKQEHFLTILQKPNSAQWWISALTLISITAVIELPYLREKLHFIEPSAQQILLVVGLSLATLILGEFVKWLYRSTDKLTSLY